MQKFLAILENQFVAARRWGILNLDEVLIVPGGHAVTLKLVIYHDRQMFIA